MIATITVATVAALAAPVAGLLGYRQLKRAANARKIRITTPNSIDESGFVRIGGIDQWVSIRGEDLGNPVLLEILGGPGASNLVFLPAPTSGRSTSPSCAGTCAGPASRSPPAVPTGRAS